MDFWTFISILLQPTKGCVGIDIGVKMRYNICKSAIRGYPRKPQKAREYTRSAQNRPNSSETKIKAKLNN